MPTATTRKKARVTIRMYRQGLGDCFLLSFPKKSGEFHLLIDCGVIMGTAKPEATMTQVARDLEMRTKGKIDLLVATHEHWDHLSGFTQARDVFDRIKVGEVWFAWTEEPGNALADELRNERALRLRALRAAMAKMSAQPLSPSLREVRDGVQEILSFFGADGEGGGQTKEALDYVAKFKDAKLTFCRPKDSVRTLKGLEGVRVYVLGPPEDRAQIKRSDPTKTGKEVYDQAFGFSLASSFLAALGADEEREEASETSQPFDAHLRVSSADAKSNSFFQERYGFDSKDTEAWRRIDEDWLGVAGELALALDSDTNNTSLALAIEFIESGDVLLFPADAQVGNWLSWHDRTWQVKDARGKEKNVTAADLLARTVFYKVGHHGSHNATLREKGLEMMSSADLMAVIPVNQAMAKKKRWNMPLPPLWTRLEEKTRGRVVLTDRDAQLPGDEKLGALSKAELKRFRQNIKLAPDNSYLDFIL